MKPASDAAEARPSQESPASPKTVKGSAAILSASSQNPKDSVPPTTNNVQSPSDAALMPPNADTKTVESVPNPSESVPNPSESVPNPSESAPNPSESVPNPSESVPNTSGSVKPDEPPSESTVAAPSDSVPQPSSSVQIPLLEGEVPIPETDDEVAADILDSRWV